MTIKSARIGIDVGGTFTDAILIDGETGKLHSAKAFTTPKDRSSGVIDAIRGLSDFQHDMPAAPPYSPATRLLSACRDAR